MGLLLRCLKKIKRILGWALLIFVWLLASLYLIDSIACLTLCPIDEEKARQWAVWKFERTARASGYNPAAFVGPRLSAVRSPFGLSHDCGGDWVLVLYSLLLTRAPLICGHGRDPFMYIFWWHHVRDREVAVLVHVDRCAEEIEWAGPTREPPPDALLPKGTPTPSPTLNSIQPRNEWGAQS